MIRLHLISVLLFSLLFAGCSSGNQPSSTILEKHEVVITTLDTAHQSTLSRKQVRLLYLDQDDLPHTIHLAENQIYRIPMKTKNLEILYLDRDSKKIHYLLKAGDSLNLKLKDHWPQVEILSRSANKYESNFQRSIQQELYGGKLLPTDNYYYYWLQVNNSISPITGAVIAEELNYLKERIPGEILNENQYIDSLLEANLISREIAEYYQSKNDFELMKIRLFGPETINFGDSVLLDPISSLIKDQVTDSTWNSNLRLYQSSFIKLHHLYLFPKLGNIESLDSLLTNDFYQTTYGNHLLMNHIDRLLFECSVEEGNRMIQTASLDSTWEAYFKTYFSLESFNTDWIVSDRFYRSQSFRNVLANHSGSYVFLYQWSVPCPYHLKVMPLFIELMQEYANENIAFIPIAISPGREQWKWRDSKYFGESNHESYQVDSLDLQKIKRRFIPRFLLFGPDGNLLHGNAPRANSDEVRPFLDGYLKKEIPLEDPS